MPMTGLVLWGGVGGCVQGVMRAVLWFMVSCFIPHFFFCAFLGVCLVFISCAFLGCSVFCSVLALLGVCSVFAFLDLGVCSAGWFPRCFWLSFGVPSFSLVLILIFYFSVVLIIEFNGME